MAAEIDPRTSIGRVVLTVRDLASVREFYERVIGLHVLEGDSGFARLGASGRGPVLLELIGDPDAPPRPAGTTGLFHQAFLVPTRGDLAQTLRRLAAAGWPLSGASDHLVSEALYLDDPEGNGIEIYRDRPRETWQSDERGIRMATLPLDLRGLLEEAEPESAGALAEGTRIGHVHLNVADLAAAERFYAGALGFEITVRGYPGALFAAAGGYHHHLGLNTWQGEGAPPPPSGAAGLRGFEVVLPEEGELVRVRECLQTAGITVDDSETERSSVLDPSGNRVILRVAA